MLMFRIRTVNCVVTPSDSPFDDLKGTNGFKRHQPMIVTPSPTDTLGIRISKLRDYLSNSPISRLNHLEGVVQCGHTMMKVVEPDPSLLLDAACCLFLAKNKTDPQSAPERCTVLLGSWLSLPGRLSLGVNPLSTSHGS
jgi:hypothetical protein